VALGVWSFVAPPGYRIQHVFNATSPSQDGAFVHEALGVSSVRDYLADFPHRAGLAPAALRGTRLVSNPPGATLVALSIERLLQHWPGLQALALGPLADSLPHDETLRAQQREQAVGLVFFWVLTGMWVAAAGVLYGLGRLYLVPRAALAYALCCVFAPATLLLTPGKDSGQLLTVAIPLGFWLWAVRRDRPVAALLAGLALPAASLFSLVHIWVAATMLIATWFSTTSWRRFLLRLVLPAGLGFAVGVLGLQLVCSANLMAIIRAVARAQAEVTRGPGAMPLAWQLLGIPLFVLFVGPAWWTFTAWTTIPGLCGPGGNEPARFGRLLVIVTAFVMLATVGFTNLETPRLWIPFTPVWLLGAMLQLEGLHHPSRRTALLLALLVGVQVVAAALQWSLMDMREAETRLVEQRFFG
jgi:hypothetical protein